MPFLKQKSKGVLWAFNTALFENLASFSNGETGEEFDFSIKLQDDYGIQYIDFHFEDNLIEVVSGGMEINTAFGSDSYTNWRYLIWNDGNEDVENLEPDSFNDIMYMLNSHGVQFSISTPDEFEFEVEFAFPDEVDSESMFLTNVSV